MAYLQDWRGVLLSLITYIGKIDLENNLCFLLKVLSQTKLGLVKLLDIRYEQKLVKAASDCYNLCAKWQVYDAVTQNALVNDIQHFYDEIKLTHFSACQPWQEGVPFKNGAYVRLSGVCALCATRIPCASSLSAGARVMSTNSAPAAGMQQPTLHCTRFSWRYMEYE